MSTSRPEDRQNSPDNVFGGLPVGEKEAKLLAAYLDQHDFSDHTRRAIRNDLRKFIHWFTQANRESFTLKRVTLRDVTDFRTFLHRDKRQAVASVNRALVSIRRFFDWLTQQGEVVANPAKSVKELRRQPLAPKGLERADVRRLLREVELREDIRATAIFSLMLYTGCRVSDLVNLELPDLLMTDRSGVVVFRHGKGNKHRTVPLPLAGRRAMQAYLEARPLVDSMHVFVGERGPMTDCGVRVLCRKYSAVTDDGEVLFAVARICLIDSYYKCRLIGLGLVERLGDRRAELLPLVERLVRDEVEAVSTEAGRITSKSP